MTRFLCLFLLGLSFNSIAQKGWVSETKSTYSIKHPDTWTKYESEDENELSMKAPTPDFSDNEHDLGTTLLVSVSQPKYSTIDSATVAYKKNLYDTEILKNTKINTEKKIQFDGVDAVEIHFTTDIMTYKASCRIILFQDNENYYELSTTYDQKLSKKLVKEAFTVMDTFKSI